MKRQLSPKDLAEAIGVSESSLRRWADDGAIHFTRTAGGHRRIALAEAVRFIRETNTPVVRPEKLDLGDIQKADIATENTDRVEDDLFEAFMSGDARRLQSVLLSLYMTGTNFASLCDGPLRRALSRIGELWDHDERGVYIEHRAVDVCLRAMGYLHQVFPEPKRNAPVAIGGAPSGDPYSIPSLMCATVLAEQGFHEVNLGPNTPLQALAQATMDRHAKIIWISISCADKNGKLNGELVELANEVVPKGTSIAVGGRAADTAIKQPIEGVHVAGTMAELAAFARGLVISHKSN